MYSKTIVLAAVAAASCTSNVEARPSYLALIPNGSTLNKPLGHNGFVSGALRNQFGKDFAAAGNAWTPELCGKDSDGDGKTNGEELGDPNCVWSVGNTPEITEGITNPAESLAPSGAPTSSPTPSGAPTSAQVSVVLAVVSGAGMFFL